MISKRCIHCGKRIPVGKKCNCISSKIYKPTSTDKYTEEIKQFYHTSEWLSIRELCISHCYGIDIYNLFTHGTIEYGQTVHHIIPIIDDYSLRLDINNLIYLTDSNHRIIHELYKTDYESTVQLLRGYVKMFNNKYFLPSG